MLSLIALALLQGISEFLPISSSGHLVLGKAILGISTSGATIEIFLHVGTLMAIIVFYRKKIFAILSSLFSFDFRSPDGIIIPHIICASLPAGIVGILFGEKLELLFSKPIFSAIMLIITSFILFSTFLSRRRHDFEWSFYNSFLVGLAQAIAILPGISRSGTTIAAAMWLGAEPEDAAEFSFIMAIPAILGAAIIKTKELIVNHIRPESSLWLAIIIAAVVGYAALLVLIPIIKRGKLWTFGIYCMILGMVGLLLLSV
ncbi:undecaprenyl-diphosphate phosphatase [bacterium]|nr:MAG: undecaprenyl-diphosphate phosphatase [bacterium]